MSIGPDSKSGNGPPPVPPRSLCFPNSETSCFGCCPPIRPARYDPLDYRGSLRREFIENRRRYLEEGPSFHPIVGYSCWALGFLDPRGRLVGCLLHPLQNAGKDLRHLVDYDGKCGREFCVPARMFSLLTGDTQSFWLQTARGFDPFRFSSPKANPLFHLLRWGPAVLEPLHAEARKKGVSAEETLRLHPFLSDTAWRPLAHRYLFRLAIEAFGTERDLAGVCRRLRRAVREFPEAAPPARDAPGNEPVHLLPLERDFLDFLRLDCGWEKGSADRASVLMHRIDRLAAEHPAGLLR